MSKRIVIDPVTRIEGHAKITIQLDDDGEVTEARFHVTEFRGFERFCVGRPLWEMAGITARICGICPVSHLIASSKAGDRILAVIIPEAAEKLRRLMNLGQLVQSHALSFFHLSGPDLVLGMDSDPGQRNVFGLIAADPELARAGIRLRQFGQEVIERLGGKRIHPAWTVPGGVRDGLDEADRVQLLARIPEAREHALRGLSLFKQRLDALREETQILGNFPSLFMGLVGPDGAWEHYDGQLRVSDSAGNVIVDRVPVSDYREYIGEAVEPWSYLKFPYFKPMGYPNGMYRVGPLARLNVCSRFGTPLADRELRELRDRAHGTVNASFLYHHARLIEILGCLELIELGLRDPAIRAKDGKPPRLRAEAGINQLHGIGASEAPRGTLFHDYTVDEQGLVTAVNLVIATGQNNLAMNRAVTQVAKHFIKGDDVREGLLNRVEHAIRAFDPCLSCSTHAAGQMPMEVTLVGPAGEVRRTIAR